MASLEEYISTNYICDGSFKQLGVVNVRYRKRNTVYRETPVFVYVSMANQRKKVPNGAEFAIKNFFHQERYKKEQYQNNVNNSFILSNSDKTYIFEEAVEYINFNESICHLLDKSLGNIERVLVVKSNYPTGFQFHLKINRRAKRFLYIKKNVPYFRFSTRNDPKTECSRKEKTKTKN